MPRTFASTLSQPQTHCAQLLQQRPTRLHASFYHPSAKRNFQSHAAATPEHRSTEKPGWDGMGTAPMFKIHNGYRPWDAGTPHLTQGGEKEFLVAGTPSAFLLVSDLPTSQCPLRFLCDLLLTVRSLRRGRVCLLSGMPSFILIALKQESEEPPPSATNNGSGQTAAL